MKDFVIIHMLDNYEIDKPFQTWGFHMTLLPWFSAPSLESVVSIISPSVAVTKSIALTVGELAPFGNRTARVVGVSTRLQKLHEDILNAVEQNGWPIQGRYTKQHFRPHIVTKHGHGYEGDEFMLDKVQIAESLPQSYRRIVAEIGLK